jgi:hypothetical protein
LLSRQQWLRGLRELALLSPRSAASIRRECLDHFVVLGEVHLCRILRAYARYYNAIRTHRSLNEDAPVSRPVQRTGNINSPAILGGLHHHLLFLTRPGNAQILFSKNSLGAPLFGPRVFYLLIVSSFFSARRNLPLGKICDFDHANIDAAGKRSDTSCGIWAFL